MPETSISETARDTNIRRERLQVVAENDFTNEDYTRRLESLLDLAVLENGNLMLENYNLKQKIKFLEERVRELGEEITGRP